VTAIIKSIEKRWMKADQDLFIACVFLHPYFKMSLFNDHTMTVAVLLGILRRLYTRVFRVEEAPGILFREIMAYKDATGIFLEQKWPLASLREGLQDPKVRL
jgi:hypothetical protein